MEIENELGELENGMRGIRNNDIDPLTQGDRIRSPGTSKDAKPAKDGYSSDTLKGDKDHKKKKDSKEEDNEEEGNVQKKKSFRDGRCGRLIALIIVIVISWLIVQAWAGCYDLFMKKVIKADSNRLIASVCIAIIFTVLVIWILCVFNIDDLFSC